MSKYKKFALSAMLMATGILDAHYHLYFVAIPLTIASILLFGSILKKELGL